MAEEKKIKNVQQAEVIHDLLYPEVYDPTVDEKKFIFRFQGFLRLLPTLVYDNMEEKISSIIFYGSPGRMVNLITKNGYHIFKSRSPVEKITFPAPVTEEYAMYAILAYLSYPKSVRPVPTTDNKTISELCDIILGNRKNNWEESHGDMLGRYIWVSHFENNGGGNYRLASGRGDMQFVCGPFGSGSYYHMWPVKK